MRKTALFTILACSIFANVEYAHAQTCPGFPARGTAIIDTLVARNLMLAHGDDDQRRTLTRYIAEQMRFELGAWSTKSASPTRPPSKDSVALPVGDAGAFCNWDWQNGQTRERAVWAGDVGEYIADQTLLPTAAVNHIGGAPVPVPTPEPVPVPVPTPVPVLDLQPVLERLRLLEEANERRYQDEANRLAAHDARLQAHAEQTDSFIHKVSAFVTNSKTLAVIAGLVAGRFAIPQ